MHQNEKKILLWLYGFYGPIYTSEKKNVHVEKYEPFLPVLVFFFFFFQVVFSRLFVFFSLRTFRVQAKERNENFIL